MKQWKILLNAAGMALGMATFLPAQATPPDWAPAHGYRAKHEREYKQEHEYKYVYYPAQQIYYAPASSTWFWLNGGNWQFGVNLPASYQGYRRTEGVPVVLTSARPYVQHVYVEEHYGRPWREKHRHKHDRDHHHHEKHGHQHHGDHDHDHDDD